VSLSAVIIINKEKKRIKKILQEIKRILREKAEKKKMKGRKNI
jgi:hypothetical protein